MIAVVIAARASATRVRRQHRGAPTAVTADRAAATPSTGSPGGAFAGFLAAARNQDNTQVPVWLATTADTTDLNELLRVYTELRQLRRLLLGGGRCRRDLGRAPPAAAAPTSR